jgi:hypothetical protein
MVACQAHFAGFGRLLFNKRLHALGVDQRRNARKPQGRLFWSID